MTQTENRLVRRLGRVLVGMPAVDQRLIEVGLRVGPGAR